MLNRLWVLTLLQLSNKMKLKVSNKKQFIASVALKILSIVIVSVAMIFMLYLVNNILMVPVNVYFVIFFIFVTQVASIVACTAGLMVDLYISKDNQILLAYPAHHNEVFVSKLMVFYINELIKNLFFLVPLLIAFGFITAQGVGYYFHILSMTLILPMLPVLIAALLSIPLTYVKKFFENKNTANLVMIIVSVSAAFVLLTLLLVKIPTPIRIVQLYNRFVTGITLFMQSSAKYSLIYNNVGRLLFGTDVLLNYAIVLGVNLILILAVFLVSRPLYFNLACRSTELTVRTARRHREAKAAPKSLFWTFVRKEWILSKRNIGELMGNYMTIILFPFVMSALNYIYLGIGRSSFGNNLVIGFDIMIGLMMVMGANSASASALTVEGFEFILVKMAPSDTKVICWAKITFNLIFSSLMILFSFLLFNYLLPWFSGVLDRWMVGFGYDGTRYTLPQFADLDIWLMFVIVILVNAGHVLWSFQIDLLAPKLSDYASTGSLSNNRNISQSMVINIVLSLLFGAAAALLLIDDYASGWIRIVALAAAFFIARLYLFGNHVKYYFSDIEF